MKKMKRDIYVHCVAIKQHLQEILVFIKNQFTKVWSIHVQFVVIKQHLKEVLLHMFSHNTKIRNIDSQVKDVEIYSQSDASQNREEELQIYLDNLISRRLTKQLNRPAARLPIRNLDPAAEDEERSNATASSFSSENLSAFAGSNQQNNEVSKDGRVKFYRRKSDSSWTREKGERERKRALAT